MCVCACVCVCVCVCTCASARVRARSLTRMPTADRKVERTCLDEHWRRGRLVWRNLHRNSAHRLDLLFDLAVY
jgi:hypothetical protein